MTNNGTHLLLLIISIFVAIVFPPILFILAPIWIGVAMMEDRKNNAKSQH